MDIRLDEPVTLPTFKELADEVEAAASGSASIKSSVRTLGLVVALTAARRDPAQLAALQGRLVRLIRRLDRLDVYSTSATVLRELIEGLLASLQEAETAALMEIRARERESEVRRLRERVLEMLRSGSAQRPGQLVRALRSDPAQVSRAIRELEAARLVAPVPAPPGGDRRGRWYAAVDAAPPPAERRRLAKPATAPRRYALTSLEHQLLASIYTRESSTSAELRRLTGEQSGELRRTVEALTTLGLVDAAGDALALTQSGTRELLLLFEEGVDATIEALDDFVPDHFGGAVALAGAPGSGKRAIADEFARRRAWPHASIGIYIRNRAFAEGADGEVAVRAFGERLIQKAGWTAILRGVIEAAGAVPGEGPVVVDGFRYPEGLDAFEELYTEVRPVFLDVPPWLCELRLHQERQSGFASDASWLSTVDVSKLKADFDYVLSLPAATLEMRR